MSSSAKRRLGDAIRGRRKELGLSQGALARALPLDSVDGSSVSRWELGKVRPRDETIEMIAEALDMTFAELVAGVVPEAPSNGAPALDERVLETLERIEQRLDEIHTVLTQQQQDRELFRGALERFDQGLAQARTEDQRDAAS